MTEAIANFFSMILTHIYNVIPNFGAAIVILTVLIKLVTYPLNNKQLQSSKRMQELNPEIKKIQQKYKNDKEKQNQATMDFMKEHKINPMAGCLPMLVQLPILYGIFRLLRETGTYLGGSINTFLIPSFEFIDLAISPSAFKGDLTQQIVYYLFPILSGVSTYIYQKLSMTDTSQKMLLYMMPAMFIFFSFSFPAGLIIYWITSNLLTMGQHYLIVNMDKKKSGEVAGEAYQEKSKGKSSKTKNQANTNATIESSHSYVVSTSNEKATEIGEKVLA